MSEFYKYNLWAWFKSKRSKLDQDTSVTQFVGIIALPYK